jgi:diguanylate cyclase (GGDEF)-like protein
MSSDYCESAKGNILIVDDKPESLQLLTAVLQQAGYPVTQETDSCMVLSVAKTTNPDVIILEADLVGINGYELCRQIKATPETNHISVIFLSFLSAVEDKVRAFEAGAMDFISKPFQPPELVARLQNYVSYSGLRLELEAQSQQLQKEIADRITAEKALQEAKNILESINNIDLLTKLSNRPYFDEYLEGNWRQMQRESAIFSLIICDIDLFKLYNEVYGHEEGDECLRKIAQAMMKVVKRPGDLAARYGGEQFTILLPRTDASGAITVAKHIQREVLAMQIPHRRSPLNYLTVSIGVSMVEPTLQMTSAVLISATEQALAQAKQEGRNQIIFKRVPNIDPPII